MKELPSTSTHPRKDTELLAFSVQNEDAQPTISKMSSYMLIRRIVLSENDTKTKFEKIGFSSQSIVTKVARVRWSLHPSWHCMSN